MPVFNPPPKEHLRLTLSVEFVHDLLHAISERDEHLEDAAGAIRLLSATLVLIAMPKLQTVSSAVIIVIERPVVVLFKEDFG